MPLGFVVLAAISSWSGVLATVDNLQEEALEAIGVTGDTLTGIVSALIHSGLGLESASAKAAKINRLTGSLARSTLATQVYDILRQIPHVFDGVLTK